MRHWMNVPNVQFNLWMAGSAQQVIGTMLKADEIGCEIWDRSTGIVQSYNWRVIEHACMAP